MQEEIIEFQTRSEPHQRHPEYIPMASDTYDDSQSRRRITEIVNRMERDATLMQDNPKAELLRIETLRDMPQNLTLKRQVKAKLSRSVSKKSKHKPLGFCKQCKYRISMMFVKFQMAMKDVFYSFELWYSALKSIEGYFGSGVATYFKFLRLLFVANLLISIPIIGFIIIPQVLYNLKHGFPYREEFKISNIITGEGYLSNTILFYGHYTNESVSIIPKLYYVVPYAYFFTMIIMYVVTFVAFSTKMAKSYRHSFIETKGGLKNVYAHKIFCGWDFSIATKEGADLKATSIYNELKELLSSSKSELLKIPFMQRLQTFCLQASCHSIVFVMLGAIGFIMWQLLGKYNSMDNSNDEKKIITALVITIIMNFIPLLFTWIVKYEGYKNPRTVLYVSLFRTFLLEVIVVGVLLGYWLQNKECECCWETLFGQEIYRLVIIDFLFTILFALIVEFVRFGIYKYLWSKIGIPEFDIARHTLQIIYNQTLFWIGLYFSPLLSVIITLKFFITWYIKQIGCMYFSKPSTKSWRAAQTHTLFLAMTFFALLVVIVCLGFIILRAKTSSICGPFQSFKYMHEILGTIFDMNDKFINFIVYLTKPGVISGLLIAMSVYVYYLWEKSIAQKEMVMLLRDMLATEAKDKEFLLTKIGQINNGEWLYNLRRTFGRKELYSEQSSTWKFQGESSEIPSTSSHYLSEDEVISNRPRSRHGSKHFEGGHIDKNYTSLSDYSDNQEDIVHHHRSESPTNVWHKNSNHLHSYHNYNDLETDTSYKDNNDENEYCYTLQQDIQGLDELNDNDLYDRFQIKPYNLSDYGNYENPKNNYKNNKPNLVVNRLDYDENNYDGNKPIIDLPDYDFDPRISNNNDKLDFSRDNKCEREKMPLPDY